MRYTWLLKGIVAPDRSNLELGDARVLQHRPQFCFHLCAQLLYSKQQCMLARLLAKITHAGHMSPCCGESLFFGTASCNRAHVDRWAWLGKTPTSNPFLALSRQDEYVSELGPLQNQHFHLSRSSGKLHWAVWLLEI